MKERAFLFQPESSARGDVLTSHRDAIPPVAASVGFWSQLVTRIRAWFQVPVGYEDETGFHYGPQPAPKFAAEATSARARILTDRASHVMKHSVVLSVAPAPAQPDPATCPTGQPEKVPH